MKNKKFFLYVLFFILFSHFSATGQELSNSVYNFLKQNKYRPVAQNLLTSGENSFPYNIIIDFPAKEKSNETLLLVFYQEEVDHNRNVIKSTLEYIRESRIEQNVSVLFSYGENQKIEKQGMIYGSSSFLNNLNSSNDFTAIIFDLSSSKNMIISNSNGTTAPAWLIKNEFNIFLKSNISENLPLYYLSQMYRLKLFSERILDDFFKNNIPAIKLNINKEKIDDEKLIFIIKESINKYSQTEIKNWDQHFLMLRYFTGYVNLSEKATIQIILVIILVCLFSLMILFFVNTSMKKHAWQRLKKIWYIVPVTFAVIYLSFFEGKFIFNALKLKLNDVQKIYFLLSLQIFIGFLNTSIIYLFTLLYNKDFEARSIDYLIIIACFINQSLFILVDISLFPIFMIISLLSILALSVKNNVLHIIIFIFMIIPFVPYLHDIVKFADIQSLKNFVLNKNTVSLAFTFILYPILIVDFRILTYYRNIRFKKSSVFIGTGSSVAIILITLTLISSVRTFQLSKINEAKSNKLIRTSREELIDFNYFDKDIFNDTIRTIFISLKEKPLQCDVTLIGENHSPILYTDNDFEIISQNSVFFKIPYNPPQKMSFSYGILSEPCTIKITAIFQNQEENDYTLVTKMVSLGE